MTTAKERGERGHTMPNENETPTPSESTEQQERTFTQAELDAIVRDRLKREREKYADYTELRKKAEAYDAAEEASKSELQKAVERAEKAESELSSLKEAQERAELVARLAAEKGVDADMLARMSGDVAANADWLAEHDAARPKFPNVPDNGEVSSPSTGNQTEFIKSLFGSDH